MIAYARAPNELGLLANQGDSDHANPVDQEINGRPRKDAPDGSARGADLDQRHTFVLMAYGDSPFLSGCLESLRTQSLASTVVVTTSTPSRFIESAAKAHGAELIVNSCRKGIAADWNFALTTTRARYVTLAHQDDIYLPLFLERTLELFSLPSDRAMCFTGYQEVDDLGRRLSSKISRVKHFLEWATLGSARLPQWIRLRAFLSFGDPLACSSVTFDRQKLGEFAFSSDFSCNLDWDAWLRLLDGGHLFVRSPERLVGRRHNPLTATSRSIRDGTRRREDLLLFRRVWPRPISDVLALAYTAGY